MLGSPCVLSGLFQFAHRFEHRHHYPLAERIQVNWSTQETRWRSAHSLEIVKLLPESLWVLREQALHMPRVREPKPFDTVPTSAIGENRVDVHLGFALKQTYGGDPTALRALRKRCDRDSREPSVADR
jgi:hypothetical protein